MKKNGQKKDRGSITILTVIVLTAVLGIGALSTDMALLYAEKSNLQNAVDSAALAAAQELPNHPSTAHAIAVEYAANNDTVLSSVEITNYNKEILVTAEKEVPLFLAKILGFHSSPVSAHARAGVSSARSLTGIVPLSITMQNFVVGQEYTLKNAPPEGVNGWYGPVQLDGNGASSFEDDLANGCSTTLSIGQILQIENGNMSGPTRQGLEARLESDTGISKNTFENHDRDAPEIIYVPIVEIVSSQNSAVQQVKILGFAAFFIENVTHNGNDSLLTGRFLQTIVSLGRETSPLNPPEGDPLYDYGLYTTKLLMN